MNSNWKTNYIRYRSLFLNMVGQYKEREDVKVYLELFLSLGTVVIFAVFALRPTLLTISTLIKEIEAKQQTIEQMDSKIADLIAAQRAYDQNRQNIELLKTSVPQNADPEVILRQVEGAVQDTQVGVKNLQIGEMTISSSSEVNSTEDQNTDDSAEQEVNMSISTTSEYINLLSFITTLEGLRKPFNIKKTNFVYSVDQNTPQLTLTLEVGLPVVK